MNDEQLKLEQLQLLDYIVYYISYTIIMLDKLDSCGIVNQ